MSGDGEVDGGDVSTVSKAKIKVMNFKGQRDVDLPGSYSERSGPGLIAYCLS